MNERHFDLRKSVLALVCLLLAFSQRAAAVEEQRLVIHMRDAVDLFEIQRIAQAAEELQAIVDGAPSPRVARRLRAVATIGILSDMRNHEELRPLVDKIIALARKGDEEVLADPDFFEDIVDRVVSNSPETRRLARGDLLVLGERAVPHLVKLLARMRGGEDQMHVVVALGKIGSHATLPLAEVLRSDNFVLRDNAVHLLGESADPRALPELVRLYHEAKDYVQRADIASAINKIARMSPEGIPAPETAYRNEALRVLSGARDYAPGSTSRQAIIWRWDEATQELVGDEAPREIYRELLARRFIRRGLGVGYTPELSALLPEVYLRLRAQLPDDADPRLKVEVEKMLRLAGVRRICEVLTRVCHVGAEDRILSALDVLYELGLAGNRLLSGGQGDAANDAAWLSAFMYDSPEVSFRAARAAVALARSPGRSEGRRIVPTLIANLRLTLDAGRFLVVSSDDQLANEAAAILLGMPADAEVVRSGAEALARLDESTAYSAIILDAKDSALLGDLTQRGLLQTLPVIYLATEENMHALPQEVTPVTLPLVGETLVRVARECSQRGEVDLSRAVAIADILLLAKAHGYIGSGELGGLLGDLIVRGGRDIRERLFPLVGHAGDTRDLVPLFSLLESGDYTTAEKELSLFAIGGILQRNPEPTADMLMTLCAIVTGDDPALARAAASVLPAAGFADDRFAETFRELTAQEGS